MPGLNPQLFARVKGAVLAQQMLAGSVAPRVRVKRGSHHLIENLVCSRPERRQAKRHRGVPPLKRWATHEVAGAACSWRRRAAAFLTGQTIRGECGVVM